MQIAKPQVHLRKDVDTGVYMIHVVTWMDQTKFRENGHATLPTAAVSGVYIITLKVREDSTIPNMSLLTPVVHTLTLTDIGLDASNPFIEIVLINSDDSDNELGRRKPHYDDADTSGMPGPKTQKRAS